MGNLGGSALQMLEQHSEDHEIVRQYFTLDDRTVVSRGTTDTFTNAKTNTSVQVEECHELCNTVSSTRNKAGKKNESTYKLKPQEWRATFPRSSVLGFTASDGV